MRRNSLLMAFIGLAGLLHVSVLPSAVFADGTEVLGDPSITIASGTGVVAAGTGLKAQPGTINVSIPAGASIEQVLLYWSGEFSVSDDDYCRGERQFGDRGRSLGGRRFSSEATTLAPTGQTLRA